MTMSLAGADAASVTLTLSNVDVFSALVSWLVTASPTSTGPVAASVVLPTEAHDDPSVDTAAATVVPVRVRRSQTAGGCTGPPRYVVSPPFEERVMNSMSFEGRRSRMTSAAEDDDELR